MRSDSSWKKNDKNGWIFRLLVNRQLQVILFTVWFIVVMILSVIPDNTPDYVKFDAYEFRLDYLKHFLVFLPLGFLLRSMWRYGIPMLALISLVVVALPEGVQYFLSYRTFNPYDLAFNGIGFIFGIFVSSYFNRKFKLT